MYVVSHWSLFATIYSPPSSSELTSLCPPYSPLIDFQSSIYSYLIYTFMVAIFFLLLIIFFSVGDALIVLPDKRKVHIIKNDILLDAVGDFIVDRVEELAVEAISKTDSFSISIGSGTTVKPLVALADRNVDLSKVHIFFGNERTEGDAAGKCSKRYVSVIRCIICNRLYASTYQEQHICPH